MHDLGSCSSLFTCCLPNRYIGALSKHVVSKALSEVKNGNIGEHLPGNDQGMLQSCT